MTENRLNQTPNEQGYRMPAEWHRHGATQLHWPSNKETWPGERLVRVEEVFLNIIEALYLFEPVILLADPPAVTRAKKSLKERNLDRSRIHLYRQPLNDMWARDCGPIFIRRETISGEEFAITDWEYNAWGGKYSPYEKDNHLPKWFVEQFQIPYFQADMVLEGGAIDSNGDGVLLTTESVLLNPNRNPEMSRVDIDRKLRDYLGIEKIIWLKKGLAGDDTDGHIDDLARFLNKNTILAMRVDDPGDINYVTLKTNLDLLKKASDTNNRPFQIETLPLPETKIKGTTVDGSGYVPASYANFYVANGVVLVPLYDHRSDPLALKLFRKYFPERKVIGIPCMDLVWGQGSIHCVTQQLFQVTDHKDPDREYY
ncbi:MAG: agmatine deiminase family protein [Balneolaceae bacterium]